MQNPTSALGKTRPPSVFRRNDACRGKVTFASAKDNIEVSARPTTFHDAYVRYAGDVCRFAHWLTGNAEEARDITSETFVRAFTGDVEPRMETVKAYLFTIAQNLHRQRWRRARREEPLSETLPDPALAPDEVAAGRDEFHRALAAVQTLPELDRAVLLLRAEEGLAYEEIATITGLSVTAAKVRVFRARARLAELLQPKTESSS